MNVWIAPAKGLKDQAKITSLRRAIEHLSEDRSTRWSKDAAKLADRAAAHVEELSRLITEHP
ncbi:hypothetical protein [Nocardioides immobilis]|nr:hypothetical protein [Nocardioides immobilis]